MPFVSNAQRKYLFAKEPEVAKEFAAATPKGKKLPEHVKKKEASAMLKEILQRNIKIAERDQPATEPGDSALKSGKVPVEGREIEDKAAKMPKGKDKMKEPGPTKPPEGMKDEGLKTAKVLAKAASEMTQAQRDYVMFGKKPTTSVQPTTAPPAPAAPVTAPAPKSVEPVTPPVKPATGMNSTQNAHDYVLFGGKKVASVKVLGVILEANKAK